MSGNVKPYKTGLLVGRFQMLHKGHGEMIGSAVSLCERVAVFVGSSQESGTEKNPFSYELRREMLETVFPEEISVFPLPDIGVGNNSRWGDYVLDCAVSLLGELPDLVVSGKESRRSSWLDSERGDGIAELFVPKSIDISASRMREMLLSGDLEEWKKYTDERLWSKYGALRALVISSENNNYTQSI